MTRAQCNGTHAFLVRQDGVEAAVYVEEVFGRIRSLPGHDSAKRPFHKSRINVPNDALRHGAVAPVKRKAKPSNPSRWFEKPKRYSLDKLKSASDTCHPRQFVPIGG